MRAERAMRASRYRSQRLPDKSFPLRKLLRHPQHALEPTNSLSEFSQPGVYASFDLKETVRLIVKMGGHL